MTDLADIDMCPLGHDNYDIDAIGRMNCMTCTRNRARMQKCLRKNVDAGRHPRETMVRVPNETLRERYLRLLEQGVDAGQVARNAGYIVHKDGRPDIQRLKRALGVTKQSSKECDGDGQRIGYYADRVNYDTAVVLCHALGADPAEVGV